MGRASETKYTAGGQEYNWTIGWGRNKENTININGTEYTVPASDIAGYNANTARALMEATLKNGPLSKDQIDSIIGEAGGHTYVDKSQMMGWYQTMLDVNSKQLGYDSSIYQSDDGQPLDQPNQKYINKETGKFDPSLLKGTNDNGNDNTSNPSTGVGSDNITSTATPTDYNAMVEAAYQDKLGLMTDPTGAQAQQFRNTMYGAISEEQAIAEQSLGQAELDAYRMLGQQQLELENTIAEQRKKALVSGTTSAQLAAGQLQNMFAAQSGAAQVAQSLANQRTQMNQTFAEKRTGVETSLYDYINQQQTIAATAGAQNLAALSSYASYANKNYNDMMSLYQAKQDMSSSAWKEITEILNKQ